MWPPSARESQASRSNQTTRSSSREWPDSPAQLQAPRLPSPDISKAEFLIRHSERMASSLRISVLSPRQSPSVLRVPILLSPPDPLATISLWLSTTRLATSILHLAPAVKSLLTCPAAPTVRGAWLS